MEIVILLLVCVVLLNFTNVSAMYNQEAIIPRKRRLHILNIPPNSRVVIEKVINGEDAHNDVVYGFLEPFDDHNVPSLTGNPFGSIKIYFLDERGQSFGPNSQSFYASLGKISHFENHGQEESDDVTTGYRCTIGRGDVVEFHALLEHYTFERRQNAGNAIVMFVNHRGNSFVGKLNPGVAPVAALPPAHLSEQGQTKKQKRDFASGSGSGSSSSSSMLID